MAITKTTKVKSVDVSIVDANDYSKSVLCLELIDTYDDPEDSQLPLTKSRREDLANGTDLTAYPQLVQDIAATVWN